MQIDKQQILEFLQQQGRQDDKQQAEQELPQQVDTDNRSTRTCSRGSASTRRT
jgi:hypothetical protein